MYNNRPHCVIFVLSVRNEDIMKDAKADNVIR